MESFNKFKKKIMLEVLLKSIMIGLSIGLISFSLPFIYIKVKGIEFNILLLVLIAFGILLVTFGLSYLFLKPSKIKIAKRIDKELSLNQKVQTMVEYEKEDNFMINLQRENTLSILDGISIKNLSMKLGIFAFIILGLSCACCITSFAIPAYEEPEVIIPTEPTYEADDWTIKALLALIEYIEDSSADNSLKNKYIELINGLVDDLEENIDKESQMKDTVFSIIDTVKLELDKKNTNNEVYVVLRDSSNSLVSSLAVEINLLDTADVKKLLLNIIVLISGSTEAITEFNNDFTKVITSSKLDKNDDLYKTLVELAEKIYECRNSSDVNNAVSEAVNKYYVPVIDVLNQQLINKEVAEYIEDELINIFSLYEDDSTTETDPNDNPNNPNPDDPNPGDDKIDNTGGLGTGDIIFGSDDSFFDPEKGNVVYGDVITDYYGDIDGKFNDEKIPSSLKEYFKYYFDILFGDLESDKE